MTTKNTKAINKAMDLLRKHDRYLAGRSQVEEDDA
jgi:hypothetical protein